MSVSGAGGGGLSRKGGIARSRRQVFTLSTSRGGGEIDVILGVNGFIWVSKHVEKKQEVGLTRLEESVDQDVYSSQNEEIGAATRREIARVTGVIRCLVEAGKRVDEDMVVRAYATLVDLDDEMDAGDANEFLGGEKGQRLVEAVAAAAG
jgi:exosome complex component RRP4